MVRAAIAERINEIAAASELSVQRVVKEYISIAFASVSDYQHIDADGNLTFDFTRCTPEQMAAIKSVRIEEPPEGFQQSNKTRKCTITMHDKMIALDKLTTFLGILEPDNPHWRSGGRNTPAITADSSESAAADAYASLLGD
jgi:hypothetical protein